MSTALAKSFDLVSDRVGIGWRPELGLGILEHADQIDLIEITAENCMQLSDSELRSFSRLASHFDLVVHALSLGLASTYAVNEKRLAMVARVVNLIEPEAWSEHLAFVRTDQHELGHLAAPPWSVESAESTVINVQHAAKVVGSLPHLENIATLYRPIGSTLEEALWTSQIIKSSGTKLLIDLENIYANSKNFRTNCTAEMLRFPLEQVQYVHIAGGHTEQDQHGEYFLDDHLHPVSEEVFGLLEELALRTPHALSVILERDGNYPAFEQTGAELSRARLALSCGRKRRAEAANAR